MSLAPAPAPGPVRIVPAEQRLRVALLLSLAGGFLDAFTWLAHGRVFANAQTGNVVLLGLYAAQGQWAQALHHVPPIIAFVLGVFVAHRLRVFAAPRERRAELFSLGLELAVLVVVAAAPERAPDVPIVLAIAFVAALQTSCFARVEQLAYSSVMTTGNLRRTAETLFAGLTTPRDPAALQQAGVFARVIAAFAGGTAIGGLTTPRLHNAALAVPICLLAAVGVLCLLPAGRAPGGSSAETGGPAGDHRAGGEAARR